MAELEAVWVGNRQLQSSEFTDKVKIYRGSCRPKAQIGMMIALHDSIEVNRNTSAALLFDIGSRVTLDSSAAIKISNPSIFAWIGRLLIQRLGSAAELLKIQTRWATVSEEGSMFLMDIDRRDGLKVSVIEGRIRVSPSQGDSASVSLNAEQQAILRSGMQP